MGDRSLPFRLTGKPTRLKAIKRLVLLYFRTISTLVHIARVLTFLLVLFEGVAFTCTNHAAIPEERPLRSSFAVNPTNYRE